VSLPGYGDDPVMGVCPRCGQAFAFTDKETERPIWLGGALYLEGSCVWCDVRPIVPSDQTFHLVGAPVRAPKKDGRK
jgi:hypothetical protein